MDWKKLIATGFGAGCLPVAPGTWGTLPGVLLCWLMQPLHPAIYLAVMIVLILLGIPLCSEVERQLGEKDHASIVFDEITAFPLTMFLAPFNLGTLVLGFLLNRLMDIVKIWPCRALQSLPGGWGIMLDDLAAAVYSCALLHLILHVWNLVNHVHHV